MQGSQGVFSAFLNKKCNAEKSLLKRRETSPVACFTKIVSQAIDKHNMLCYNVGNITQGDYLPYYKLYH